MTRATHSKLIKTIDRFLNDIREKERKVCTDNGFKYCDPLQDVCLDVDPDSGLPRLTYDGQGYDMFSYCADDGRSILADAAAEFGWDIDKIASKPTTRERLDKLVNDLGWYIEDNNSWSMVFIQN